MRGKRAKQYRKLMHEFALTFNFREPYQVLLDADIIQDAARFKMDLIDGLQRTLQGNIKPMITQCSMRHLYLAIPKDEALIEKAKTFERRRCNHHTLEAPLSTLQCFAEVVDSKGTRSNKHRYIVASQDSEVRQKMREIPGIPLLYIHRSVMILEPMAQATIDVRNYDENEKLRAGLKESRYALTRSKRKRDDQESRIGEIQENSDLALNAQSGPQPLTKRRRRAPKGPNPLSVRKPKKMKQVNKPIQSRAHEIREQNS